MKLQIYHTVNAGLYLWNGRSGLLIDALHGGKGVGFSDTSGRYVRMMQRKEAFFGQTNDLLFTHMHEDHYDEGLVKEFLELNPDSLVYGPGLDKSNIRPIPLEQGIGRLSIRDYTIYTYKTRHDGKAFAGCPHDSYLIEAGGELLWIGGDAALEVSLAEKVKKSCKGRRLTLAFAMVYQIESRQGIEFLREVSSEKIYLYHLPYREDDCFHYYHMAEQALERCGQKGLDVILLKQDSFVK